MATTTDDRRLVTMKGIILRIHEGKANGDDRVLFMELEAQLIAKIGKTRTESEIAKMKKSLGIPEILTPEKEKFDPAKWTGPMLISDIH